MTRIDDLKAAFNAGEFSPRLIDRVDFDKYPRGCATLENMVPLVEGVAMRRAGSKFVKEVKTSANKTRLFPFEFSTTQAYMIEMGDYYFRFFKNQGQITAANITASITNGTFPDNINGWDDISGGAGSIAHDATNDRLSLIPGGATAADIGVAEQEVTNAAALDHTLQFQVIGMPSDSIELRIGTATGGTQIVDDVTFEVGYHTYTFTATAANFFLQFRCRGDIRNKTIQIDNVALLDNAAVEVMTPYAVADVFALNGPQSADVLYLFHEDYPTHKLTRYAHDSWSLIEVAWEDGPYEDQNEESTYLLDPSATTGLGITIVATGFSPFASTDVGRLVAIEYGNVWGYAIITAFTSATEVTADVRSDFTGGHLAEADWKLGKWCATNGYPKTGTFYEQRLFGAGHSEEPQNFIGSQTGDFENMKEISDYDADLSDYEVQDDDACDYTISADNVNAIQWISPGQELAIGTAGGEWVPSSDGPVLTPTDIDVKRHTAHGSIANVQPLRVDNVVLFVQKAGRKIREFAFTFESDRYQAPDMTQLAYHITKSKITQMAYQQEPNSLVWCVRTDGQIATMTYKRQESTVAWSRQILGGSFGTGDAVVESVSTIPGNTTSGSSERDEVWVIVKRTIDGSTVRYVEFFEKDYDSVDGDEQQDAFYVDSGLSLDSPITITAATAADPVVVTGPGTNEGLADGDEIAIVDVVGMTDLDGNYYVANAAAGTVELTATTSPVYITGATKADPVVCTSVAHGYSDGDLIGVFDVVGMTELNGKIYMVDDSTADTYELQTPAGVDVDGTGYTTYVSGGATYHAVDSSGYDAYTSGGEARERVTTISGLDHLEGETVGVWGDGAILDDATVASGAITLTEKVSVAQIGLRYSHTYKSLKVSGGNPAGTPLGKVKIITAATLSVRHAHTCQIGPDDTTLEEFDFREVADPMDAGTPLFTGTKFVDFSGDYDRDVRIVVTSDDPCPFELISIAPEIRINKA